MKYVSLIGCLLVCPFTSIGQSTTTKDSIKIKPFSREIEANFLSSYYQQDGNNAAVTGGIGTEQLTDFANVVILNIPIDSTHAIGIYGGADTYSSASTDNIDNNRSSASSQDVRGFTTISYSKLNLKRGETYGVKAGFSVEYDYTSVSGGLSYTRAWNESNSELTLSGQAFFDQWTLIYPIELRGRASHDSPNRQSYNGQLIYSQVLNKKTQISFSAEAILMRGLLATPFHRVYFADQTLPDIERLPNSRLKIPLSVRLNYFPLDNLVLRSYYRYYRDDFGIQGNTFELETPIKIGNVLTVSPFYRYHTQTGADYFAPFQQHLSTETFYTSDFDLAALSSQKYGLGIKYFPLYGLLRSKPFLKSKRVFMMKYISLRGAYYTRDTGLNAYIGSINLGFGVK